MTKLTTNERLTTAISVLALAVSAASAWHSLARDRRQDSETVILTLTPQRGDYETMLLPFGAAGPSMIVLGWQGLIANNGSLPISIVRYELWSLENNHLTSHTKMDLGWFGADGARILLPLTIEPGHAKSIQLRSAAFVAAGARVALSSAAFPLNTSIRYMQVWRHVVRTGIDLFGNRIEFSEQADGSYNFRGPSPSPAVQQPFMSLTILTARGKAVSAQSAFYDQ